MACRNAGCLPGPAVASISPAGSIELEVDMPRVCRSRPAAKLARDFWRREEGVTAIEFGLIAAPLFGLIFAVLQSSLAFFEQQGLRAALDAAARQVMTGEAASNTAIVDGPSFRNQLICNGGLLPAFMTCSNIIVDVRSAASFSSLGPSNVNSSFVQSGAQYSAGQPCQIMIVRAVYPMPSYLPMITWGVGYKFLVNTTGLTTYNGQLVQFLTAASVFRNEPYSGAASCS